MRSYSNNAAPAQIAFPNLTHYYLTGQVPVVHTQLQPISASSQMAASLGDYLASLAQGQNPQPTYTGPDGRPMLSLLGDIAKKPAIFESRGEYIDRNNSGRMMAVR